MPEQRTRQDSSRDLLEELEDGWAASPPGRGDADKAPLPVAADSVPDVNELDEGWLDQLFPEEEDDEEEEEPEPELPDERADPVAFAAAKKARDERMAARKDKKKQKLEAKRARQRAKAATMRQKQKGKSKKSRAPAPPSSKREEKKAARSRAPTPPTPEAEDVIEEATAPKPLPKSKSAAATRKPNTMQSIRLLAIVLAVLLALAAAVAIIAK
jgi:hypothetical protein